MRYIVLANPDTNEIKSINSGIYWNAIFFTWLLGLPLFFYGKHIAGTIAAACTVFLLWAKAHPEDTSVGLGMTAMATIGVLSIFYGVRMHVMIVEELVKKGWQVKANL